jgi:hypothetical protein
MGWVYECTNEDLPTLREFTALATRRWLVKKTKKIGCISSGGEVPLTVLLPVVKNELIAVDHCLGSLAWAFFKVHLLQKFPTTADFKAWLLTVDEAAFTAEFNTCIAALPFVPNAVWMTTYHMAANMQQIRDLWTATPDKLLDKTRERLDLLTFIHGDIRSIQPYGPFDLLYVSNALAHTSIDGSEIEGDAIKSLLTQRGKVIATHDLTPLIGLPQRDKLTAWDNMKYARVTCPTTRWGDITWDYNLYQKPLGG